MKYVVYILQCSDGTFYTGITNDLKARMQTHKEGKGAKYVRARLPFEVVHCEEYETRSEALKRELQIKALKREEKIKLIKSLNQL
jgi:putative endonuclease